MQSRINRIVGSLALVVATSAWGQCEPAWVPVGGGVSGTVEALAVFDDGSGPALYSGGSFATAGGAAANNIAKWDGASWSPLGAGTNSPVSALTVFDDGSGPALYAGGGFTTVGAVSAIAIAKWDGVAWSPLGAGMNRAVQALIVFDDGSGPALYAGGSFDTAGGVQANGIAKWDGASWSPLDTGILGTVLALTVFDDGSGPALYAGGSFVGVQSVTKWNGTFWSSLATANSPVSALAVFDDGSGPALYAGGGFTTISGTNANHIARWSGASWSPLGVGTSVGGISTLSVFDDGSGQALYVGGRFLAAGGVGANNIAKWDGAAWSALGSGTNEMVLALTVFGNGTGAALFAGGLGPDIVSRWGAPIPDVTAQPADLTVEVRDPAVFSLTAVSTSGPMSIQWRKGGQPMREDPPRITGTRGFTLRIDSAILDDAGQYDAVLTNVCGSASTRSATLTVTCYPDCDQSTGPGVLDLFDFLCFQSSFVTFGAYADCDGNNLLDLFDFLCFQDAFVTGCP